MCVNLCLVVALWLVLCCVVADVRACDLLCGSGLIRFGMCACVVMLRLLCRVLCLRVVCIVCGWCVVLWCGLLCVDVCCCVAC